MSLRSVAASAALGAAAMYFFDSENGTKRREALTARISSASSDVQAAARQGGDAVQDVTEAGRQVADEVHRVAEVG